MILEMVPKARRPYTSAVKVMKDNRKEVFEKLLEAAGPKPKREKKL